MSNARQEWVDEAITQSGNDPRKAVDWLAGWLIGEIDRTESLQAEIKQLLDVNDTLKTRVAELEKRLQDVQSYADAQFEQACRMEMQRNQERQRQSGRNDE